MYVVAIDGTAGSGKSTLARRLAAALGFRYIDSGAMYRAVGWAAAQRSVDLDNHEALGELARGMRIEHRTDGEQQRVLVDGLDVTEQIRSPQATAASSLVAAVPAVRDALIAKQRAARDPRGIVMDGRDIGTVVFPEADLKLFIDASPRVRASRRSREMAGNGLHMTDEQILADLRSRDRLDSGRPVSPLRPAPDAIRIDTSDRTIDELQAELLALAAKRLGRR